MTKTNALVPSSLLIRFVISLALLMVALLVLRTDTASAACAAQPNTYGSASMTITVPQAGTYRVWSRIMAPNTSANSYILEVTNVAETTNISCGNTIGDSAITANTWTWVDYKSATSTNKMNVTFSAAGQYLVKMIGREADVKLDRVVLTADTACVPTGTGENCANPPDTTPPVVSVTTPANGATVSGSTAINATATDDVGISKVEFYIDSTLRATDTTSAYSTTFDMSSLSPGSHTIYARAYDTSNNQTNSTVITVTVPTPPDTTAPTVTLTSPTAGATLTGTATLSATASDAVGVTKVEFYVDGALKATDTSSPFTSSLDTNTLSNASHSFTTKAFDAANNNTTSAAVSATVNNPVTPPPDTTLPSVSVSNPTAGATVTGSISFSATATDNVGVTKVDFIVDGAVVNTDSSAPFDYTLNTTSLTNAQHTFAAKAYDAAGNTRTSTGVTVTVSNVSYLSEDINQDGRVNIQDFSLLASKFGQTGSGLGRADINGDGRVNIQDFSLLAAKFGQ